MSTACGEKRGEYAGYMRHIRAGESACDDCLRGGAAYQKQRQKTPPEKRRLHAAALAKARGVRLT